MKPLPSLAGLFLTAALLAGCASHEGAYQPVSASKFTVANSSNFVLMDPGTQRSITCSGIQQTALPDGRLQVAAQVCNRENRRLEVQIDCEFKDEQGFTVDSVPWQTLILTENATETVTFASMNNLAKKYTVRVRQAR